MTALRKLFGTDGVRGVAGVDLTEDLARDLGAAAAASAGPGARVVIGRDTRESGPMLEEALVGGVASAGGRALRAGVIPTPAVAVLTRLQGAERGCVISASHNPYEDNGIKFFGRDGMKLPDDAERCVEAAVLTGEAPAVAPGRVRELHGAGADYLRELELRFQALDLTGLRVLLDCANGATYRVAPEIFRRLGASVETVATEPDGRNINEGCGSTHIERLAEAVPAGRFDAGFAFDGDGDRVLAVDRRGSVVDGDELIALSALHLRSAGRLPGDGVAVTVMTNYGFHTAMAAAGINVAATPVGDRHVVAELVRRGWALGGEQSGHIIDTGFAPSGDGTASALLALEALGARDLAERDAMTKLPQLLINVKVAGRASLDDAPAVLEAVEQESAALEGRGRVLVRASGTESLIRVMVEAPDEAECRAVAERLAQLVQRELG